MLHLNYADSSRRTPPAQTRMRHLPGREPRHTLLHRTRTRSLAAICPAGDAQDPVILGRQDRADAPQVQGAWLRGLMIFFRNLFGALVAAVWLTVLFGLYNFAFLGYPVVTLIGVLLWWAITVAVIGTLIDRRRRKVPGFEQ